MIHCDRVRGPNKLGRDGIYTALYGGKDNKEESSSATKVVDVWPFALFGDDNYEEDWYDKVWRTMVWMVVLP